MIDPVVPFEFGVPTRIAFGRGASGSLGEWLRKLGLASAFLVIDPGVQRAGVTRKAIASLEGAKVAYQVFSGIKPDPLDVDMEAGAENFAASRKDCVVGIGGGSAMDTAKAIALLTTNGGRVRDYNGTDRVPKDLMPLICIPTTAGTGSEVTANIAVANADTHEKMSVRSPRNYPRLALLDPELLADLPAAVAAASGLDALVHAIESYVSNRSNVMTRMLAFEAMRRVGQAIERFVADPGNHELGGQMLFGSMLAGMAISHTGTGAAHAVARAIGGRYDVAHGLACGVLLEPVMRFNLEVAQARFAEIAQALGLSAVGQSEEHLAKAAITRVAQIREAVGLPRRLAI